MANQRCSTGNPHILESTRRAKAIKNNIVSCANIEDATTENNSLGTNVNWVWIADCDRSEQNLYEPLSQTQTIGRTEVISCNDITTLPTTTTVQRSQKRMLLPIVHKHMQKSSYTFEFLVCCVCSLSTNNKPEKKNDKPEKMLSKRATTL